jgi:hypothetical protein
MSVKILLKTLCISRNASFVKNLKCGWKLLLPTIKMPRLPPNKMLRDSNVTLKMRNEDYIKELEMALVKWMD